MFTVERNVGHLVEVKMESPVSEDEIARADGAMAAAAAAVGSVVIAADYRGARILPQALAEKLVGVFRKHNAHIDRSAVLIAHDSAVALLQMERVIREANNPARRFFRDAAELVDWLRASLDEAERARLRTFYGE